MPLRRLILIGGGEHARVVAEAVRSAGDPVLLGFVDPYPCEETVDRLNLPRLGDDEALLQYPGAFGVLGFGTVGDPGPRIQTVGRLGLCLAGWAVVVHASAWVSPTARLGEGTVVMASASVQGGAQLGSHCVVNTGAVIEHDVHMGDHVQIAPGAVLGGGVHVGEEAYVGLGARVRDHVTIGKGATIGMGAVVVGSVPANTTVMGVPAK